ncbi:hypothetical protein [Lactiplantibacillus fabifermentans]|uniref:Uncharacterized protein n=2 Tax=Lactiplantibacillus fabifermentans TaxID=483011 RepID=A0A0R2NUE6_9LACO|nr:hypothetical protein [Lactiplantibacillus fabifermentans]ETY72668.1 hypothetical protein LFAB_16480 [Lactiplantibacillus fabifermentans T30PCM01]KRO28032.1 hypothetical protein DY78_GL002709 [Lactiplantibacillus fabifermentans DSM 21115]
MATMTKEELDKLARHNRIVEEEYGELALHTRLTKEEFNKLDRHNRKKLKKHGKKYALYLQQRAVLDRYAEELTFQPNSYASSMSHGAKLSDLTAEIKQTFISIGLG